MPDFETLFAVRVKRDVGDRIRRIADREGNTKTAVLRRALSAGLEVIDERGRDQATQKQKGAP